MKQDDMVVYSQPHYEWLVAAGRWPRHRTRRQHVGIVREVGPYLVTVTWRHESHNGDRFHFPDNLEAL